MQCDAINLVPSKKGKKKGETFRKYPKCFHMMMAKEGKSSLCERWNSVVVLRNCLGKRNFSISFHYQKQEKKHHMTELLSFLSSRNNLHTFSSCICCCCLLVFMLQKCLARKCLSKRKRKERNKIESTRHKYKSIAPNDFQRSSKEERKKCIEAPEKDRKKSRHLKGRKNMWHTDFRHRHPSLNFWYNDVFKALKGKMLRLCPCHVERWLL